MKLQALLSVALATIATAHPAPLSTRGEYIGSAYSSWSAGSGQVWDLSVTGGCINFQGGNGEYATNAAYKTGFRCRFYKYVMQTPLLLSPA
jgi:hypothetical protein